MTPRGQGGEPRRSSVGPRRGGWALKFRIEMMGPAVVFDTNIYRSFSGMHSDARFNALLEQEQRREVAPYADPWVIMELLAHVADPHDRDFALCRRAARRVYVRCAERPQGRPGGIINDSESQIARLITGKPLPGHENTTAWLGNLCHAVAVAPADQPLALLGEQLQFISDHVAKLEAWFVEHFRGQRDLAAGILAQVADGEERGTTRAAAMRELRDSKRIRIALAELIIRGAHKDVGQSVPEPLDPALVEQVWKVIPVGIEFHVEVLRKVIYDGANLDRPRTRNLMWDERISYIIGQELEGGPIWFITNDPAFGTAAAAAGYADRVKRLDAYERWLAS